MCLYPKVYTQSNININDINGHIHSDEGTFIPNGTTSDRKDFFAHHYNSKDFMLKFISEKHVKKDVNAFFVVDISEIYNKVFLWFEKLPRVKPYYAVKCNSDSFILKTMISLGCGFDCASKNEIKKVLELGVKPENIIYANPCKQDSYIRYAREVNVKIITFDNAHELIKISRLFPDADLVIRILTNDEHSLCQLGSKFGTPPSALSPLFKLAKQLKLRIIGVSFHVGSGCFSAKAFGDAISRARLVFDLAEKLSMPLRVLDLGGGFPGIDEVITFSQVALVINRALNKYFPFVKFKDLSVIAEPGRFFVTTSHSLAVNVIAKRTCLYPVQRKTCLNHPHHLFNKDILLF
jgi:ornithine decarboxylase